MKPTDTVVSSPAIGNCRCGRYTDSGDQSYSLCTACGQSVNICDYTTQRHD